MKPSGRMLPSFTKDVENGGEARREIGSLFVLLTTERFSVSQRERFKEIEVLGNRVDLSVA